MPARMGDQAALDGAVRGARAEHALFERYVSADAAARTVGGVTVLVSLQARAYR
jgi:hypothetical protein